MAKEQAIKTFKEGSRIYVVIDSPSKEVEAQIDALFGGVIGDLAAVLKPEAKEDASTLAAEIEAKMEPTEVPLDSEPKAVSNESDEVQWDY